VTAFEKDSSILLMPTMNCYTYKPCTFELSFHIFHTYKVIGDGADICLCYGIKYVSSKDVILCYVKRISIQGFWMLKQIKCFYESLEEQRLFKGANCLPYVFPCMYPVWTFMYISTGDVMVVMLDVGSLVIQVNDMLVHKNTSYPIPSKCVWKG